MLEIFGSGSWGVGVGAWKKEVVVVVVVPLEKVEALAACNDPQKQGPWRRVRSPRWSPASATVQQRPPLSPAPAPLSANHARPLRGPFFRRRRADISSVYPPLHHFLSYLCSWLHVRIKCY